MRRDNEETKKNDRAYEEKAEIQIGAFGIEISLVSRRDNHPGIKMMTQKKNGNEKEREDPEQHRNILQLTSHYYRPLGVSSIMHNRPEKTAGAQREEKGKGKEPGVTELVRIHECADDTKHQRHNGNDSQESRKPGKTGALEIFAFRRGYSF